MSLVEISRARFLCQRKKPPPPLLQTTWNEIKRIEKEIQERSRDKKIKVTLRNFDIFLSIEWTLQVEKGEKEKAKKNLIYFTTDAISFECKAEEKSSPQLIPE